MALSTHGQRLYDELAPSPDAGLPETDGALENLVDAMSAPMDQVSTIRGLGTDLIPYRIAMNPLLAPAWVLPWLAQFVGVIIPVGASEADARAMILARYQQERGRPATIIAKVKEFLTGEKSVAMEEHASGDPFHFRIYLQTSEVPDLVNDPPRIKRAVSKIKPGGFTFELIVGVLTYDAALNTYDAAQGSIDAPGSPPNP